MTVLGRTIAGSTFITELLGDRIHFHELRVIQPRGAITSSKAVSWELDSGSLVRITDYRTSTETACFPIIAPEGGMSKRL